MPNNLSPESKTIAVAIPIRIALCYSQLVRVFERYVSSYGYRVVSTTIGHLSSDNAGPDFESLLSYPVSGIVLIDLPESFHQTIQELCPKGWPIVSAGVFTVPTLDSVKISLEKAVTKAISYLLDTTDKDGRIAFFGPGISDETTVLDTFAADRTLETRIAVYSRLMNDAGRPLEIIAGNPGGRRESASALREHISEYGHPRAIFCFNDDMAIVSNHVLRDLGIKVPQEVMLIGCDGLSETEDVTPSLSTVEQPYTQLTARSFELIEKRIADPNAPIRTVTVEANFLQRQSSTL